MADSDFAATGICNDEALGSLAEKYSNVDDFLKRDEYLPIRCVNVQSEEFDDWFEVELDIDGIVIEWKEFNVSHIVRCITILPNAFNSLRPMWSVLKKHVEVNKCSDIELKNLRKGLGTQVFYENGWEYWIGLSPSSKKHEMDKETVLILTRHFFQQLAKEFQKKLRVAFLDGKALNTLKKNNLNDVKRFRVLPDDSIEVVNIFQGAFCALDPPTGLNKIQFSFRFGEKCRIPVDVPANNMADIKNITVHFGISLSASVDLFWSRQGLQEIVGQRGVITTCMSFIECANYQSNLDGTKLDVKPELLRVCKYPENVRFVQLYADLPHRYPKTRPHPVSGSILMSEANSSASVKSFQRDAEAYLSEMENNINLLSESKCRLEFVAVLPDRPSTIEPNNYVSKGNLERMLRDKALVVPFFSENRGEVTEFLRRVGLHIVTELKDLYRKYQLSGNTKGVWASYQLELAIEKLLWGHPLCHISNMYSINLGPGVGYPSRCRSDQMGFLALDNMFAAIACEEDTPPLRIYTNSECSQSILQKLYGLDDYIDSSKHVLGRKSVLILLKDLFDVGKPFKQTFENFLCGLKCDIVKENAALAGGISVDQLCQLLGSVANVRFPMVFKTVLNKIRRVDCPCSEVIKCGIMDLNLGYFPAVRLWDINGHRKLDWKTGWRFWKIEKLSDMKGDIERRAGAFSQLVITDLEHRKLVFSSRTKGFEKFPWMSQCLKKLEGLKKYKLSDDETTTVLTFVSCIAFIQQGWYVDYTGLQKLVEELPLHQMILKNLEIQAKTLLAGYTACKIWRLHHTIPVKGLEEVKPSTKKKTPEIAEPEMIDVDAPAPFINPENEEETNVRRIEPRHYPARCSVNWGHSELKILAELHRNVETVTLAEKYAEYVRMCRDRHIPDRTRDAFKMKYNRLRQAERR